MNEPRIIAVSNPGGLAKQFRIQVRQDDTSPWHQSAVFMTHQQAELELRQLLLRGLQARLIHYRAPSAA